MFSEQVLQFLIVCFLRNRYLHERACLTRWIGLFFCWHIRIDLGLNNGQGWFQNFTEAPPLLDKYLNIFCDKCGLASYWAARFGRFYFHQKPDLVSHWLEGFANCTLKEKWPAHRQILLIRQQQQTNQRSAWVNFNPSTFICGWQNKASNAIAPTSFSISRKHHHTSTFLGNI